MTTTRGYAVLADADHHELGDHIPGTWHRTGRGMEFVVDDPATAQLTVTSPDAAFLSYCDDMGTPLFNQPAGHAAVGDSVTVDVRVEVSG